MNLIELTKKLVSYKTVSGNFDEIEKCFSFIKDYMSKNKNKYFIKEIEHNKVKSILFSNVETMDFDVLELGHIDVVPVNNDEMFNVKIENNIMKGRGVADMKSFVASGIKLFEYVLENKKDLKYGILIVSDEETGGKNGSEYWVESLGLKTKILLDGDAGDYVNEIIYKSKGSCFIKLTSKGESNHGSQPWLGIDAIESLINTINNIRKIYPYYSKENEPKDKWIPTFHVGTIKGGSASNAIAGTAEAELDFRYIDGYSNDSVMEDVKKCCDKNVTPSFLEKGFLVVNDENNKYIQLYKSIIEKQTKKSAILNFCTGASDSRFFSINKETTIIANHATCGDMHADNEWLDIETLEQFFEIRKEFVKNLKI